MERRETRKASGRLGRILYMGGPGSVSNTAPQKDRKKRRKQAHLPKTARTTCKYRDEGLVLSNCKYGGQNYRTSGTCHPKPFTQGNPITISVAAFTEPYGEPQNIENEQS